MTHIKGSVNSMHSENGYLSKSDYLKLSLQRHSIISPTLRELLYAEGFMKYETMKSRDYKGQHYDLCDLVYHLYTNLTNNRYRGVLFTSVFVDEVQDLSPAQITLFKFVSNNLDGFVFAGDTAQTVSIYISKKKNNNSAFSNFICCNYRLLTELDSDLKLLKTYSIMSI